MSIVFAEQPVQMPVVLEGHDQARLRRSHLLAQARRRGPANASQLAGLLDNPDPLRLCNPNASTNACSTHHRETGFSATIAPHKLLGWRLSMATSTIRPRSEESAAV